MTDTTPRVQLAAQLDPASSQRLFLAVEHRRKARGWTRGKLAVTAGVQDTLLNSWAHKIKSGHAVRIELDAALALLAVVGIAANEVDDLLSDLASTLTELIEDASEPAS